MAQPATLATVQELADWIGDAIAESTPEGKRAVMCLRVASALVRKESGRTWLEGESLVDPLPEDIKMVTLYCASRVFDNRAAQIRGGLDDYNEAWKVDESGAYLTASEKAMLTPFRQSGIAGIGTIATTRVHGVPQPGWVPTETPDVVFPWY